MLRQPDKASKLATNQIALDGDTRERFAELQKTIIDGDFDSEGDAATAALNWFQDSRTPKTASNVKLFGDLIRYANQVGNGEFTEVNKYISEFNGLVNSRLRAGKSTFNIMGQVTGKGAKIEGKYKNLFSDSFRRWKFSNPDASQEEIFNEYTELRDKYDQQLLDELKNPFGTLNTSNQGNIKNNNQTDGPPTPKTRRDEVITGGNETREDEQLEGVPDVSPLGNQSSNPVIDTVNQVVNALTGTQPAAAGTLDGRSVLEEIDITQPIVQPNLQRLAIEGGFTPEQARIMAAIAMAESGGVARALNDVGDDNSFGLWQINMIDVPDYKLGEERRAKLNLKTNDELYNPATNVRAAKMIFDEQGFEAWGAYTNGDYKDFLPNTN